MLEPLDSEAYIQIGKFREKERILDIVNRYPEEITKSDLLKSIEK